MSNSSLHDEKTFYSQFIRDLHASKHEVIIESPFITSERMAQLYPVFEELIKAGVRVFILTRDPREHADGYEIQSELEIQRFEALGVQVLLCLGNHHRKLAILDRRILWEGSLNILSQINSREIMRRFEDETSALEMFEFLKLGRFM